MVTAIIPARAGSKGLPNKNFLKLGKFPLYLHSVECAMRARVDKIVVSTDKTGVETDQRVTYILRPPELCEDDAHASEAVSHAIDELKLPDSEIILMLLPTSPFRRPEHCIEAIELVKTRTGSVIGVTKCANLGNLRNFNARLNRLFSLDSGATLHVMRQDDDPIYKVNGAMYACRVGFFKRNNSFYSHPYRPLIMDQLSSINIDTEEDFLLAQKCL